MACRACRAPVRDQDRLRIVDAYLKRGPEKARENLLRKRANRKGYNILKSRVQNLHADNLGEYMLVDRRLNSSVLGGRYDASLDDIEEFLRED